MLRIIFTKTMRAGKTAIFATGLAMVLAMVLGVTTTALAGTGLGAAFNLGKTNSVNAVSRLVGSTASSMLLVDNNGPGTALDLRVGPSATPAADKAVAPMRVDSQAKVDNLNADELDGKDSSQFMTVSTYTSFSPATGGTNIGNGSGVHQASWRCDPGDQLLSGGYAWTLNATSVAVVASLPRSGDEWLVQWANTADPDQPLEMRIYVRCADAAPPAHG
jgi:hypothetical protein